MKTALRHLTLAVALAAIALALLVDARLERRIAQADRDVATLNLSRAAAGYDAVAGTLAPTTRLPWLFRQTRQMVAAKQAAVRYWRGDYLPIVTHYASPDSPDISDNFNLQFIVANADYLVRQRPDATAALALGTLDHSIGTFRRLIEANPDHEDAAFNYELMVRLRSRIAAGAAIPPFERPSAPGNEGADPEEADMEDVQIYVPRDQLVDPQDTEDPTIGEGAPIRRRG